MKGSWMASRKMTAAQVGQPSEAELEFARQLVDRARSEGLSLVGPGGLLAGITKRVLESALDVEMDGEVAAESLAYLIYTSGTTGQPKAVMGTHGNLRQTLGVMAERFGLGEGDVMLQVSSSSFDIALLEQWALVLAGGRVVICRREEVMDAAMLARLAGGATRIHGVPSLMRELVEEVRAALQIEAEIDLLMGKPGRHARHGRGGKHVRKRKQDAGDDDAEHQDQLPSLKMQHGRSCNSRSG